jgi:hypothetical protein
MLKVKLLDKVGRKGKLKVRVEDGPHPVRVLLREPRQLFRDGFHRGVWLSRLLAFDGPPRNGVWNRMLVTRSRQARAHTKRLATARRLYVVGAGAPLRRLKGR